MESCVSRGRRSGAIQSFNAGGTGLEQAKFESRRKRGEEVKWEGIF